MLPLNELVKANYDYHNFEELQKELKKKGRDLPKFREIALEREFCLKMTRICEIFKTYGNLKNNFNIK